jgi:hypothetical protein
MMLDSSGDVMVRKVEESLWVSGVGKLEQPMWPTGTESQIEMDSCGGLVECNRLRCVS